MKKINTGALVLMLVFLRFPSIARGRVDIDEFAEDTRGRLIVEDPYVEEILDIAEDQAVVLEEYTVQKGDWLTKIAAREYDDPDLWEELILRYNKALRDPNLIYPGDKILLPAIVDRPEPVIEETPEKEKDLDYAKTFIDGALMLENFDSRAWTNIVGGEFGAWDKDGDDITQSCELEFSENVREGARGYSLKMIYDVDSPRPAFNGMWMELGGVDFSDYNALNFWVKGDGRAGFTDIFKVELKNARGETGEYKVWGITSRWQKKSIPFVQLRGISDFTEMDEFIIVFEDRTASPQSGVIYIDDIHVK